MTNTAFDAALRAIESRLTRLEELIAHFERTAELLSETFQEQDRRMRTVEIRLARLLRQDVGGNDADDVDPAGLAG